MPVRKKPIASYSFCMRSAGSQGTAAGIVSASRAAGPPNNSFWPTVAASCARCAAARMTSTAATARSPLALDAIEGARRREAFEHALVDGAWIDAAGEIGQIREGMVGARRHDRLDRLASHALEGRQRVVDGVAGDVELDTGAIDRGRLDLDAEPHRLGAELRQLVGIAHVERHRGGDELDRIIRFHIGGLVSDQRIGGGVALVETVVGEALKQLENLLGLAGLDPRARPRPTRSARAAPASRCGSSCPWRGAAGRLRPGVAGEHLRGCITCSW